MENDDSKTYRQKRLLRRPLRFTLHDNHLEYDGITWGFRVLYRDIAAPVAFTGQEASNLPIELFSVYLVIGFWAFFGHGVGPQYGLEGLRLTLLMLAPVVLLLIAARVVWKFAIHERYTAVPTAKGNMFVLKDRHHDAIIGQIGVKRMADLRKMAEFDPANSAEEEKAKLRWLQSEGALSAEEALYLQNRLPAEAA